MSQPPFDSKTAYIFQEFEFQFRPVELFSSWKVEKEMRWGYAENAGDGGKSGGSDDEGGKGIEDNSCTKRRETKDNWL